MAVPIIKDHFLQIDSEYNLFDSRKLEKHIGKKR